MGSYIGTGVKYIKIARYDANGNDNYTSLRELDKIRIRTNDAGIIEYPIATITEYPSSSLNSPYFLYQIVTTNITSSTNNQILDYRVSASMNNSIPVNRTPPGQSPKYTAVTNFTESIDNLNYFDTSSGYYIPLNTPNIPLIYTASLFFSASAASTDFSPSIALIQVEPTTGVTVLSSVSTGSNVSGISGVSGSLVLSGSFTPVENYNYFIGLANLFQGSNVPYTASRVSFLITQSISPVVGIGAQTILEPYITTPFVNSDYNAIINNASENRLSTEFMDVDYANNPFVPINRIAILSGSATPASVQDSNYSSLKNISSRYIGKQLQSARFNVWSSTDTALGKTPNVSNPKSYFVRFNWLAGTTPEWGNTNVGKTNVSIKYIIDENGTEIIPVSDQKGINLGILEQTFGGSNATLLLTNPDSFGVNLDSVNNTVPIFRAGQRIKPILYTQTASYNSNGNVIGFGFTGSINFTQPDGQILSTGSNNYSAYVLGAKNLTIATADEGGNITFNTPSASGTYVIPFGSSRSSLQSIGNSASFFSGSSPVQYWYQPTGSLGSLSSSGYILYFSFDMKTRSTFNSSKVTYILQKSTNGGSSWSNLFTSPQVIYTGTNQGSQYTSTANSQFAYTERNATTSSLYRLAVIAPDIPSRQSLILDEPTFIVRQYPAATFNQTSTSCTLFWVTGSSPNILLANTGSVSAGGLNQFIGFRQKDIINSGFDPITLDFNPQSNDEIRFQGLENLSFIITNVTQSATGQLQLNLDNNIPNGTNLDYFLLRRYVYDPGNVILDITKPAGQTSDGVLVPEFLGEKATETKEKIVSLLRVQTQN